MSISHTLGATALTAAGLVLATVAAPPAHSAPATRSAPTESAERAARPHVVTAAVSRDAVVQGHRVVIRGAVRAGERGDRVQVQIRYLGGRWQRSDLAGRLDRSGRFRITDKITSSRSRAYRIVKPAGNGRAAGRSRPVRVAVYSWRNLGSFERVSDQHTYDHADVKMNGVAYPGSVVAASGADRGGIAYNLERRCRQLRTRVGIADTSAQTATGTAWLRFDGIERFTGSYTLTRSSPITLPLTEVFRLSFDWTSANPAGTPEDQSGAHVALGSPRLLCRD
ncbi:hypothetical protein [Nocardioides sp. W7]|uniref:hypothetical protein n=1 Tax=Nocardioides sp. W7 TaxID=2931390 RepID=UPI001FD387FD|nr:hypothetical protein [Nocardioides sp. W7]